MTTLYANPDTLLDVLAKAQPGDRVDLGGQAIDRLVLKGVKTAEPGVTITGGVIAGAALTDCAGIALAGNEITPFVGETWMAHMCVYVVGSERVVVERNDIHGTDEPKNRAGRGVFIRASKVCAVRGNAIHDTYHGVSHLDCHGLEIAENAIQDLYGDAIRGGGQFSDIAVLGNDFRDLTQIDANHADAIQFWTSTATERIRGVRVEDNRYRKGKGTPYQGVFIGDEAGVGYEEVVVRGNAMVGGAYNAISVGNATDPLVEDNFVQGMEDSLQPGSDKAMYARIMLRSCRGGRWGGNLANRFAVYTPDPSVPPATPNPTNVEIPMAKAGDYSALDAWLAARKPSGPGGPDPRDALIAELQAQLEQERAADVVEDGAYEARIAELSAQLEAAQVAAAEGAAALKAEQAVREAISADRAEDRTLMAEAQDRLAKALASFPA